MLGAEKQCQQAHSTPAIRELPGWGAQGCLLQWGQCGVLRDTRRDLDEELLEPKAAWDPVRRTVGRLLLVDGEAGAKAHRSLCCLRVQDSGARWPDGLRPPEPTGELRHGGGGRTSASG